MDSLTHIVLGAAIGEALLGKKIGRKAMLWGAVADTIPDFDVFTSPCVSHAHQLLIHRGITHSFLFAVVVAILLGKLFERWQKHDDVSWKNWAWLFFLGMFTHDIIDSFTCYGTGWFEPFSSYRVCFNSIFVADPFYTLPFLICVLIALIAKNRSSTRIRFNNAGIYISSAYLLFTLVNKWHVHETIGKSVNKQLKHVNDYVTTPTPLNNFLWMVYASDSTGYWFGYYSIFDTTNTIDYYHIAHNKHLLKPIEKEQDVMYLKEFSRGYYCITKKQTQLYFNDIRFGQVGGWDKPDSTFVFSFKLANNADNGNALNRNKLNVSYKEAIISLYDRIRASPPTPLQKRGEKNL